MECEEPLSGSSSPESFSHFLHRLDIPIEKKAGMEKTYKSAVVIAPPLSVCGQIQEIRAKHDNAYSRWMPHINLVFPYYEDTGDNFSKHAMIITKHLITVRPFEIEFTRESIGYFLQGRRMVVWLKPLAPAYPASLKPDKENIDTSKSEKVNIEGVKRGKEKEGPDKSPRKVQHEPKGKTKCITPKVKAKPRIQVLETRNKNSECYVQKDVHPVGLDALRYAIWTPENTREEIEKLSEEAGEPGWSALRFAFEGVPLPLYDNPYHTERCQPNYVETLDAPLSNTDSDSSSESSTSTSEDDSWESLSESSSAATSGEEIDYRFEDLPTRSDGEHYSVMKLQEELELLYPDLNDQSNKSSEGFRPHLTLGQFSHSFGKSFIQKLKEEWKPVRFICKEVCLISRRDLDPFHIIARAPFSAISTEQPI